MHVKYLKFPYTWRSRNITMNMIDKIKLATKPVEMVWQTIHIYAHPRGHIREHVSIHTFMLTVV